MANVTSLSEFLQELAENGKDGASAYNLRNEDAQQKARVASIPKLKKEKKKKSKLLVVMELAIPFNPTTGKADDMYNPGRKFRPQLSATTVALMLKKEAANNEDVKNAFMTKAGVDNWDLSNVDVLTADDEAIFKKYRVPSVYSFPIVHVDVPLMTGDYGRDYIINVQRDALTNQVIGEKPLAIKANEFFRDIAYEEYKKFQDDIASGRLDLTDKQKKDKSREIWGNLPVSDDHPVNYLVAVEVPLDTKYKLTTTYGELQSDDFKKMLVQTRRTKALDDSIQKYVSGDWERYDKHFDFVEIDMVCPAEGETPMEIGQATTYEKPTETLEETAFNKTFEDAFRLYFDENDNMESIMINSVRIPKYDETVEAQLCTALNSVVDKDNEFLTKEVIAHHREFITIALGDMGDELLMDLEMDDENRATGQLDQEKAAETAKAISLEDTLNNDELLDLDVIE